MTSSLQSLVAITTLPGASNTDQTTLLGTSAADSFSLGDSNLYVDALGGGDTVTAADAVDKITVVGGDDNENLTFSGELTNGNLTLGKGNDTSSFQNFSGTLLGGSGVDIATFTRTAENSNIRGEAGNDSFSFTQNLTGSTLFGNQDDDTVTISGEMINSTIYGGKQRDTLNITKATNSLIRGDKDDDTITVTNTLDNVIINGNANDDTIDISSTTISNTTAYGGAGNDTFTITAASALVLSGDKGNDTITANINQKLTISGGAGNDTINSNSTSVLDVNAGDGDNSVDLSGDAGTKGHTLVSGTGDDTLIFDGGGKHSVTAGSGADTLTAGAGNEIIDLGAGDDEVTAAGGDDTIYGRAGEDTINLGTVAGNYLVYGGADDDEITIASEDLTFEDVIKGDDGSDTLTFIASSTGDIPDAKLTAVDSVETLVYKGTAADQTITLGTYAIAAGVTKVDNSSAGNAADNLTVDATALTGAVSLIGSDGTDVEDVLKGGAGNDYIYTGTGTGGGDTLTGGAGNDTFEISAGVTDSAITDLSGSDVLIINSTANGVDATVTADFTAASTTKNNKSIAGGNLIAADGIDIDMTNATGQFGFDIDGATSGSAAHTLKGSAKADSIAGGDQADSLVGNGGADTILGGAAADAIFGGAGADNLDGEAGADTIDVGSGGANIVQYDATTDGSVEDDFTSGYDTITNFLVTGDAGAVDQFDLDGFTNVTGGADGTFEAVDKNAIAEDKSVSYLNPSSATADDLTSDADVTGALGTLAGNVTTGDQHVFIVSKTDGSAFGIYGFTADNTDTTIATAELSMLALVNTASTGFDADNIV